MESKIVDIMYNTKTKSVLIKLKEGKPKCLRKDNYGYCVKGAKMTNGSHLAERFESKEDIDRIEKFLDNL